MGTGTLPNTGNNKTGTLPSTGSNTGTLPDSRKGLSKGKRPDINAIESTFKGLTPEQQKSIGGQEGLVTKLQVEQLRTNPGINFDAAVGNVVGSLPPIAREAAGVLQDQQQGDQQQGDQPPDKTAPDGIDRPILDFSGSGTSFFKEPKTPSLEDIRKQETDRAQAMIDATNALFQENLIDIRRRGQADLQQSQSIGVGAGLAGSPFAAAQDAPVIAATAREKRAETARRSAEVARIMGNANDKADQRFLQERQLAAGERRDFVQEQQANREEFLNTLALAGEQGIDYNDFTPEQKAQAKEKSGLSDFGLDVFINANKPKPEQKDIQYEVVGGKMIGFYTEFDENGKPHIKQVVSDVIPGLQKGADIQIFDGVPYVIGKDANGNLKGEVLPGFKQQEEKVKVETIGNVKDGVYERQSDGTWKEVIAPKGAEKKQVVSDSVANTLGIPLGSTREEANIIIRKQNLEKAKAELKDVDDAALVLGDSIERMSEILSSKGLSGSVGTRWFSRLDSSPLKHFLNKGNRIDFLSSVDQLTDQAALDALIEAKSQGATFGALSNEELKLLKSSATKINNWIERDDQGRATKIKIDEKIFIEEVNKLMDQTNRSIALMYNYNNFDELKQSFESSTGQSLDEALKDQSLVNIAQELRKSAQTDFSNEDLNRLLDENPNLTDEEISDLLSFNNELSSSVKGSNSLTNGSLNRLSSSIVQQESGGSYSAVGQVPAGHSQADRALGKYQIVPKFHFAKIGLPNTPAGRQKFLTTPALQDELFNKIIGGLAKTYNNDPRKIAAAYYGGSAGANVVGTPAGDRPQFAGGRKFPSINSYVNSVLSRIA